MRLPHLFIFLFSTTLISACNCGGSARADGGEDFEATVDAGEVLDAGFDAGTNAPSDAGSSADGLCGAADGGPLFFGPTSYLSAGDSPFPCEGASNFYLETLEDDSFDLPGATHDAVFTYPNYGAITDSVDFDDGVLDGDCHRVDAGRYCQSLFASGATGVTISFSADDGGFNGKLPSFAGLVWTDGDGTVSFEAFGADGGSLGTMGPFYRDDAGFPGSGYNRQTDEDRFFGVVYEPGIQKIHISNSSGGIEIDHPQAGR